MGTANKWAGGSGGKMGKSAYGAHVAAQYAHLSPSTSSGSSKRTQSVPVASDVTSRSSHNDINRFMSGIEKKGQYNSQPQSSYEANYQGKDTGAKSKPQNPSGTSKANQRVPNKKVAAPDRYNPRTPNMMKTDSQGKFIDKSKTMNKLASSMKKK